MPPGEMPDLYAHLKSNALAEKMKEMNDVRNWLKHHNGPDEMSIYEFEVIVSLMRAISRFVTSYHEITSVMQAFDIFARETYPATRARSAVGGDPPASTSSCGATRRSRSSPETTSALALPSIKFCVRSRR
jgi:hypothetical protein